MTTVEEQVKKTILEEKEGVRVGAYVYAFAPPSVATLIRVSALISQMTTAEERDDNLEAIVEGLRVARGTKLGDIAATLILGAEGLEHPPVVGEKAMFFGLYRRAVRADYKRLRADLLNQWTPGKLSNKVVEWLSQSEIAFFLQTSIFLSGVNLTRATKTTASGQ